MINLKKKIVLGTWSLSGDLGEVKMSQIYSLINYCIKKNYIEFDIAPTYGFGKIDKILYGEAGKIEKTSIPFVFRKRQ